MPLIALCGSDEKSRRQLALAIEELGHRVTWASDLRGTLELLGQAPQAAVFVANPETKEAETFLVEAARRRPLLPIIIALERRNAARAVDLLKAGAFEVIAPPWTRESVGACLSKALRFLGTGIEVVRPLDRARHQFFYAAAAIVFFGVACGYAVVEHRQKKAEERARAPLSEWELPYTHPSGMTYRAHEFTVVSGKVTNDYSSSGEFWIADWYSQAVYRQALSPKCGDACANECCAGDAPSLAVRRSLPLPDEPPTSIAFAGDTLWIVSVAGQLTKHMLDEHLTILARAPGLYQHTVGLAYDGLYLWVLDGKEQVLQKHLLDDQLTVLASYRYPGVKPAALAFDGHTLWSIDAGNKELLKHDIDDPRHILFRAVLHEYQSGLWRPTGLTWDGEHFWSVAESSDGREKPSRLFRHDVPLVPVRSTAS